MNKLYGVLLLILCVVFAIIATNGTAAKDNDVTVLVLLVPMSLYLIFGEKKNNRKTSHTKGVVRRVATLEKQV